ncbi:sensor histidine kinase [Derxia lacustris]|uniref:sensor histidine kinase n=1 Tax=Derxia lacustris TaxID=764842 RepID=UPI001593D96A|nr:PAS domain-containing sensor histidine kinase [Derxia lacustris]
MPTPPTAQLFGSEDPDQLALKRARVVCVVRCVLAFGLTALASAQRLYVASTPLGVATLILYCCFSLAALNIVYLRPGSARLQTRIGVVADLVAVALLQSVAGGVRSGLVALYFSPLVTSSLLLERSFALLVAAVVSIAIIGDTVVRDVVAAGDVPYLESGLLGATMFAVALVLAQLAQRVRSQESLVAATAAELNAQFRVSATVIQEMPQGVLILGADARVQLSNPAARRLLGRELDALEGRTITPNGGHWWELAALLQAWTRSQPGGLPPFALLTLPNEAIPAAAHGKRQLRLRPVGLAGAAPAGEAPLIVFIDDLAEAETRATQLKLASMGRLTASIAHEIRNPLAAIAHANALLGEQADPADARLHGIVADNALRIDRIVEDILSVSQSMRIDPEVFRLREAIETVLAEQLPGSAAERARVRVDVPADARLRFDRLHFARIVSNLLSNALRYASAAPGAVSITLRPLPGAPLLVVADDGPGVAPEHLGKLFEPFFTTHRKGTGLGLYLSRELAIANGAALALQTDAGEARGASFALRLPPAADKDPAARPPAQEAT